MIQGLKPYPAMKDSGEEWLGRIPEHWGTCRAKRLFLKMERPVSSQDDVVTCFRDGIVTLRNKRRLRGFTESLKEFGYQGISRGDLVIHAMDAFAGAVGISDSNGKCTSVYSVCTPRHEGVNPFYYAFCVREMARNLWILALSKGIRERSTDFRYVTFTAQILPFIPIEEQTLIVRFLKHIDQHIQRYIHTKQKLLQLFEEQKQAIIHQAVSGQIDVRTGKPYPAYKPSGVEWLRDVPEHWEARRLKTLCRMKSGDGITAISIEPEGKYPVYGGNGLRGYTSKHTHCGDFALIGRQGALCGNVHIARGRFYASEHAVVATLNPSYVLEWFVAVLGQMNLNQYSIAAAQPGLAVERVLNLSITVPPLAEQARIATYIEQQTGGIDTAISHTHRQIELIQEFRTRLIADVVIGKLDVREAAANLPNDTESMDAMDVPPATSSVGDAVSRAAG